MQRDEHWQGVLADKNAVIADKDTMITDKDAENTELPFQLKALCA